MIFNSVMGRADKMAKAAEKMPEGPEKEGKRKAARFIRSVILTSSLRSMAMSGGKSMPYNYAEAFVELSNGHIFKGVGRFFRKVRVPALPKDEQLNLGPKPAGR